MASTSFVPLSASRRDDVTAPVRAGHRWGEPGYPSIVEGLDSEHGYQRYFGSPTELGLAIPSMSVLLGMQLESLGWRWAEGEDGAIAMLSPDGDVACRLLDTVSALLDRDDTNFSWLLEQLRQQPQAMTSRIAGIVVPT